MSHLRMLRWAGDCVRLAEDCLDPRGCVCEFRKGVHEQSGTNRPGSALPLLGLLASQQQPGGCLQLGQPVRKTSGLELCASVNQKSP